MIISSSVTIGQITFVLRVAIQILSYLGLFIVGILILGHAPRVASLATHDTMNRIVGASSATTSTIKWIFSRFRRNPHDPTPPTDLMLILFLSVFYALFVSLSDVGFLGFYACSVPGPSTFESPASVNSTDTAELLLAANLVNGTKPTQLKAYHCDSTSPIRFDNTVLNNCTSWQNGTYADSAFFSGLNTTDSDVLMPRQLTYRSGSTFDLNAFYIGPTTKRVVKPIIERGLAIDPHKTGMRVVVGVPQLRLNTRVDIPKTMAIELDVGCMTLGVSAQRNAWSFQSGAEYFRTNGSWRAYTGPDYMESILHKTVDDIRVYLLPFFNASTLSSLGDMRSINDTGPTLSPAASVSKHRLPQMSSSGLSTPSDEFMGNCTAALQQQLGIPIGEDTPGNMCGLLGIGGTRPQNGVPLQGYQRMVCATATQVNMVAATVQVDAIGSVSLNISRLPSDLTYVNADYWNVRNDNGTTRYDSYVPYERFTLNDNAKSPTTHFIRHSRSTLVYNGPGAAGNAISFLGNNILDVRGDTDKTFAGLTMLDEGFNYVAAGTDDLAKWVGQVGGSYIVGTLGFNGWAALQAAPIEVLSTGGHVGSCYKPFYALGFVPLVFSATVVMCWALILLLGGSCFGSRAVKEAYGGVSTYTAATCPGAPNNNTVVAWESSPQPHLQLLTKEYTLVGEADGTALRFLKSSTQYP